MVLESSEAVVSALKATSTDRAISAVVTEEVRAPEQTLDAEAAEAAPWEDAKTRVYVCLVGDLFHWGHANLCKQARSMGDYLIVGICSDFDVKGYKRAPIMNADDRGKCALACRWVDRVVVNCPFVLTEEFVDTQGISYVIHGDDHSSVSAKKYYSVALDRGIYKTVPYTKGISTTDIIKKCCAQGAARVNPHGH